eukprot:5697848-Amphidinium_carterae.1
MVAVSFKAGFTAWMANEEGVSSDCTKTEVPAGTLRGSVHPNCHCNQESGSSGSSSGGLDSDVASVTSPLTTTMTHVVREARSSELIIQLYDS